MLEDSQIITLFFRRSEQAIRETDKLTVHYYDWDKVYIGTIVFRAE